MPNVYIRTPRANLAACLQHGQYGFKLRSEAASIEPDDVFVLYERIGAGSTREYVIRGMVKVVSPWVEDRTPIYPQGAVYAFRVGIEPLKLFPENQTPTLDETWRGLLQEAAKDVFPDFSSASWSNFQRFNRPLPPDLAHDILDWLEAAPGVVRGEALQRMIIAMAGPSLAPSSKPVKKITRREPAVAPPDDVEPPRPKDEVRAHSRIQWVLAKVAEKAELDVWIAQNDRKALGSDNKPLAELSVPEFPDLPLPTDAGKAAKLIDVLWIDGERIPAAFEVEYSTDVTKGLLRLSDLACSLGSSTVRLCIVAPQARLAKVEHEMRRPSFRMAFDSQRERQCYFLSFEALEEHAKPILELREGVRIRAPRLEDIAVNLLPSKSPKGSG